MGRRTFCSLKCCGVGTLDNIPVDKRYHPENLQADNRADELSQFRFHMKCMHNHGDKGLRKSCEVTLQDLQEQWEKQSGKCPYTGWDLKTPINMSNVNQLPKTPDRASVDRIDSSKPYTKDNIQFVSMMAQFAKNSWGDEELFKFCEAVVNNRGLI